MFRINLFVLTFHELHEFVIVNGGGDNKFNNGTCEFVGLALGISDQPGLVAKYCGNPPTVLNTEGIRYGPCGLPNLHIAKHHVVELHSPLPLVANYLFSDFDRYSPRGTTVVIHWMTTHSLSVIPFNLSANLQNFSGLCCARKTKFMSLVVSKCFAEIASPGFLLFFSASNSAAAIAPCRQVLYPQKIR